MKSDDARLSEALILYVNWRAFGDKPSINDMACDVAQEFMNICNIAEDESSAR